MNLQNLATLAVLLSLMLLALQRTERRRRWITALVLLAPAGYLIYRWAIYRSQMGETLAALGGALALNLLFWLAYGRRHPPASSEDIRVVGTDD